MVPVSQCPVRRQHTLDIAAHLLDTDAIKYMPSLQKFSNVYIFCSAKEELENNSRPQISQPLCAVKKV